MVSPIKHVMIDLETLSTKSNAAVIQAGIVWRQSDGLMCMHEYSCNPDHYRDYTNPASALFDVDQNTINFHYKTNRLNYEACLQSELTITGLADSIYAALNEAKENGKYILHIWCCGTDFDLPILCNLFRACGLKPNWSYTNVRDYRTLRELFKIKVPKNYKNDHTAGRDAVNQYHHLMEIIDYVYGTHFAQGEGEGIGYK